MKAKYGNRTAISYMEGGGEIKDCTKPRVLLTSYKLQLSSGWKDQPHK